MHVPPPPPPASPGGLGEGGGGDGGLGGRHTPCGAPPWTMHVRSAQQNPPMAQPKASSGRHAGGLGEGGGGDGGAGGGGGGSIQPGGLGEGGGGEGGAWVQAPIGKALLMTQISPSQQNPAPIPMGLHPRLPTVTHWGGEGGGLGGCGGVGGRWSHA